MLRMNNLIAGYGKIEILHGISLEVDRGEIVSVIGPNGAGKSTVLKVIYGLITPKGGEIVFEGESIVGLKPEQMKKKGIAYVPQDRNIFPNLTVFENLEMGAYILEDGSNDGIDRVLGGFPSLGRKKDQRAGDLSGGERKMLAIGMALVHSPELLLLDEPTMGLSPRMRISIFETIKGINGAGTGILLVEQNAVEALEISHRGYVLELGCNRFEGKGEELLSNPDIGRLYLGGMTA